MKREGKLRLMLCVSQERRGCALGTNSPKNLSGSMQLECICPSQKPSMQLLQNADYFYLCQLMSTDVNSRPPMQLPWQGKRETGRLCMSFSFNPEVHFCCPFICQISTMSPPAYWVFHVPGRAGAHVIGEHGRYWPQGCLIPSRK